MGPHNFPIRNLECDYEFKDPGSGALVIDRNPCYIPIATVAAETRTLAAPTKAGVVLVLSMVVDGGDCVVTVASPFDEFGSTIFTFSEVGQTVVIHSVQVLLSSGVKTYAWRVLSNDGVSGQGGLLIGAGAGITAGVGAIYKSSVQKIGGIYTTRIVVDLTGLASSTTDLDIIGVSTTPAHLGRITAQQCGTIDAVRMTCLELPAGGADDIDLYAANEATGVFDAAISTLVETALITSGGAWASGTTKGSTEVPAANQYLYLTGGEAGTAATYTAGKFLIELFGH